MPAVCPLTTSCGPWTWSFPLFPALLSLAESWSLCVPRPSARLSCGVLTVPVGGVRVRGGRRLLGGSPGSRSRTQGHLLVLFGPSGFWSLRVCPAVLGMIFSPLARSLDPASRTGFCLGMRGPVFPHSRNSLLERADRVTGPDRPSEPVPHCSPASLQSPFPCHTEPWTKLPQRVAAPPPRALELSLPVGWWCPRCLPSVWNLRVSGEPRPRVWAITRSLSHSANTVGPAPGLRRAAPPPAFFPSD